MKKTILLFTLILILFASSSRAQFPIQISGNDCDGVPHDLFAELDAGKASVLFYFMDNCGACPPPALAIQVMMNNIMDVYPGMMTGYAMSYLNSTSCADISDWVANYGHLFAPYDSGEYQVAYYGGFGMPTVVLVGGSGANKRVMFSTQSFTSSDTTIMRDSVLALFNSTIGIADLPSSVSTFDVYPNPASENISISINLRENSHLKIDIADISGRQLAVIIDKKLQGIVNRQFNVAELPDGNYLVRLQANGKTTSRKITVTH